MITCTKVRIAAAAAFATLAGSGCSTTRRDALGERPPALELTELYTFGPRAPAPNIKLSSLQGQRVTIAGYMVEMESPPRGGFYLAPYPAMCDESGAGRGGLPPSSVLVLSRGARDDEVAFVDGRLEVMGILEVGNRVSADGEVSTVRLILDDSTEPE